MTAHANKEVVKDVTTALQLEQELQISQIQRGVAVLDVYSNEWGPCKALNEAFRRLATDAGDDVDLRFFSVECNSILESLKFPDEQVNPQRPKNTAAILETLPEYWSDILQKHRGNCKPYFALYKEGYLVTSIEGVNTPHIRQVVEGLCKSRTPASEVAKNPDVLSFWEEYFPIDDCIVPAPHFLQALAAHCGFVHSNLSAADTKRLYAAVQTHLRLVSVQGIESWVGETGTIQEAFTATFSVPEGTAAEQEPVSPEIKEEGTAKREVGNVPAANYPAEEHEAHPPQHATEEADEGEQQGGEEAEHGREVEIVAVASIPPSTEPLRIPECNEATISAATTAAEALAQAGTVQDYLTSVLGIDTATHVTESLTTERRNLATTDNGVLALLLQSSCVCGADQHQHLASLWGGTEEAQQAMQTALEQKTLSSQDESVLRAVWAECAQVPAREEGFYYIYARNVTFDGVEGDGAAPPLGTELVLPPLTVLSCNSSGSEATGEAPLPVIVRGLATVCPLPLQDDAAESPALLAMTRWYTRVFVEANDVDGEAGGVLSLRVVEYIGSAALDSAFHLAPRVFKHETNTAEESVTREIGDEHQQQQQQQPSDAQTHEPQSEQSANEMPSEEQPAADDADVPAEQSAHEEKEAEEPERPPSAQETGEELFADGIAHPVPVDPPASGEENAHEIGEEEPAQNAEEAVADGERATEEPNNEQEPATEENVAEAPPAVPSANEGDAEEL